MGVCVAVMSVEAQVSGTLISGKKERERCVREGRRKVWRKSYGVVVKIRGRKDRGRGKEGGKVVQKV